LTHEQKLFTLLTITFQLDYINCSSSILHDTKIGNYNFISPNVTINGNVRIGNNVFIGSSAVIGPGVTICDNVIIGANSFVKEPIKKKGFYVGNPVLLKDR
jgi:UDP-3-O-[3-hydroxymyristoyl] glucosamine N-acyltransferase